MKSWGGRRSTRLVEVTLLSKGDTCHLCSMAGADSADHDPPRSQLVRLGVLDPDALVWLWPAHLLCNVRRKARPLDAALRAELRERRLHDLGLVADPTSTRLSPAIAARRPAFFESPASPEGKPAALSPNPAQKRAIEQEGART